MFLLCAAAIAAAYLLAPERQACTSQVVGPQALPWLQEMRARDLEGCERPAPELCVEPLKCPQPQTPATSQAAGSE